MPLSNKHFDAREASRDLAAELLESVDDMLAGQAETIRHVAMPNLLPLILLKANNAKLIACFCEANVEFLIVGGAALAIHACRDVTDVDDLDLLISPTIENAQRTRSALTAADIPLIGSTKALAKPAIQIQIKNSLYHADVLTPSKGFIYKKMFNSSLPISYQLWTLYIASMNDIIKMKMHAISQGGISLEKHKKDLACLLSF